jgi:hypothetical protein
MLRRTRLLLPLAAVLTLAPAAGAQAAKSTFSAVFEAKRTVKWDQPRSVSQINCRGENYYLANGGEEAEMKTKPFKVTVEGFGKAVFWKFAVKDPAQYGVEAKGPHKRWFDDRMGTTGGWCGGGDVQPRPERDCGTKLPTYLVAFTAHRGAMSWSANHAPWMANEKLDFYNCTLVPPTGMHNSSFPRLDAKFKQGDVFNRSKRRIVVGASKSYGPDATPVTNSGVNRTTSGTFSWKLTLTRTK